MHQYSQNQYRQVSDFLHNYLQKSWVVQRNLRIPILNTGQHILHKMFRTFHKVHIFLNSRNAGQCKCKISACLEGACSSVSYHHTAAGPAQNQQPANNAAANPQAVMGYPPAAPHAAGLHRREQTNDYAALFVALIGQYLNPDHHPRSPDQRGFTQAMRSLHPCPMVPRT